MTRDQVKRAHQLSERLERLDALGPSWEDTRITNLRWDLCWAHQQGGSSFSLTEAEFKEFCRQIRQKVVMDLAGLGVEAK